MDKLPLRIASVIMALLLVGVLNNELKAQQKSTHPKLVSNKQVTNRPQVSLAHWLRRLEHNFQVTFLFKDEVVQHKWVSTDRIQIDDNSGHQLSEILDQLELTYHQVDEQTYVLLRKEKHLKKWVVQEQISGTVTDASTGEVLAGVNILVKGTSTGASTDGDGNFELTVESLQDTLVVSYIGYQAKEVPIQGRTEITIELQAQAISGEEMVVVGYGMTSKRSDVTTSISSVSNIDEQLDRPITNPSDLLQGEAAGVTVVNQGGDPTQQANIIIRGQGTLSNNAPLRVIDGAPYYGPPINPSDIKSIDVLKGAAAAAIYGAQASSGVVLITTKEGNTETPRVEVDYSRGYQQPVNLPDALNAEEYQTAQTQAHLHAGAPPPPAHDPQQNPWGGVTRTNWIDEIFNVAPYDKLNVRVSGIANKLNYMTSFGYHNETGILRATGFDRFNWRLKTNFDVSNKIQIGQNINVNRISFQGANTSSDYSGVITNAIFMNPAAPVYGEETKYSGTVPMRLSQFAGAYGDVYNPVALLERPDNDRNNFNINATAFGEVDFLKSLTFKSTFTINWTNNSNKQFNHSRQEIGRSTPTTQLFHDESEDLRWIWNQKLDFVKDIGLHNVQLTGIYSANYASYKGYGVEFRDFDKEDDYYQYIANAGDPTWPGTSNASEDILLSMIGVARYNFDNRYLLNASLRRDKSSRLPKDNRTGFFPSVSGAWKISSEKFYNVDPVNLLKVRASWGKIGNIQSVGRYAFATPLQRSLSHIGSPPRRPLAFYANEERNPNLKWEESETYNIGLDVQLLNGSIGFTTDYYEKFTRGVILRNEPNTTKGYEVGPYINAGDVSNKGIEFTISYQGESSSGEFRYNLGANYSYNKNKLESLGDFGSNMIQHDDNVRGVLYPFQSTPGQPLRSYWLIPQIGIFQSQGEINKYTGPEGNIIQPNARPGDLKFKDTNGDGKINNNDKVYMGNAQPKINYGFNINLNYKNFDFRMLLQGVSGNKLFWGYKYNTYQAAIQPYNMDKRALNAWTTEDKNTDIPVMSTRDPNGNYGTESSWYLYDASYLRVRNVTLGYNIPKKYLSRIGPNLTLRIYGTIDNLYTFTTYPGIDPEIGDRIDSAFYPQNRTYMIGIKLGI